MISRLELESVIESGFLPLKCICLTDKEGAMTISLYHPQRGHAAFVAQGLQTEGLNSKSAVVNFVSALREELSQSGFDVQPELGDLRG
jgi:hypothetical protein